MPKKDARQQRRKEADLAQLLAERERQAADLARTNEALQSEIDERKRIEKALKGSEDRLRLVIDTIPGLVWSALPDGHIDYLNQRWIDYTGLTLEQASGWGWEAAIHAEDLPGLRAYWKSILTAGTAGEYEVRLRRADGQYRWFLFRGVPLRDEGEN